MRKLCKLLLSLSLLAGSSSLAVSCSFILPWTNNDNNGSDYDPKDEFQSLLKDFEKNVNNIINNHLNENISNLYELDNGNSTLKNEFLRLSILKDKQNPTGKEIDLAEEEKAALEKDTKKLLVWDKLSELINNLFNEEKYKIFKLESLNEILLDINYKSVIITFAQVNSITAANVLFQYNIKVSYKDISNNQSFLTFSNGFVYGITNNKQINSIINEIFNKLKTDALLDSIKNKDLFKITHEKLNINDKKSFWITNDKYSALLKEYINGKKFKDDLINNFNTNYKLEDNIKFVINEKNNNSEIFESYKNLSIISSVEEKINWKSDDKINENYTVSNKDFYDFIFRENELVQTKKVTMYGDRTAMVNTNLYEYLKNNFKKMFLNNNKEVSNLFKLDENQIQNYDNLKNNIRVGSLSLKNLKLKIGSNFEQSLPNINVLTSLSAEDNILNYNLASANFDNNFFEESAIFSSVYKNLANGIESMKEIYNFGPDNVNEDNAWKFGEGYNWKGFSLSNFSGVPKVEGIEKNLWETLSSGEGAAIGYKYFNDLLSLKVSSQSIFLNHITNDGQQDIYEWNFDWEKLYYLIYANKETGFGAYERFLSNKIYGNIKLNFMNIQFEVDEKLTNLKTFYYIDQIKNYRKHLSIIGPSK
ncbi:hypothetical protein SLITO_v1c06390 [Spiroplasma litorale]|uniref:Lipoprotein n=1 Tax=Spiroplasma litorale TaxID=216942 RepID=A0A0K1W280_9MOLU|nr:hypothetical protein [Spiroplasma litorale]AKX34268.1 hypothetical protein SLITO_v1c06390 [Spiroplasma litorale]